MSHPAKYIPGDVVFAKVKGYPPWPARVTFYKASRYKVFFYGTFETATLKEEDLWRYNQENLDKFAPKYLKRKGYTDGLDQIKNTPEIALVECDGLDLETSNALDTSYDSSVDINNDETQKYKPSATLSFIKSKAAVISSPKSTVAFTPKTAPSKVAPIVIPKTKSTLPTSTKAVVTSASVKSTKRKAVHSPGASPPVKRLSTEDSLLDHTSDGLSTKRKAVDSPGAAPAVKRPSIEDFPVDHKKTSRSPGVVHVEGGGLVIQSVANKRKAVEMSGTALSTKRSRIMKPNNNNSDVLSAQRSVLECDQANRSVSAVGKTKKLSKLKKSYISKMKMKKLGGVRNKHTKKLGFELAKPVTPSGFQMFGTPPVFKLRPEHFQKGLLSFYHEELQPLFEIYPAIIGRPSEPVDPPDLSKLFNLKVTPKEQVITNKNGVGFIKERKLKPTTVGEFVRSAKESPEKNNSDEKFFTTEQIRTKYLNDIENVKIHINEGWDLEEEDLGLSELGPMSGISTVWHYVSHPNSASPIHNEDQNFPSVNLEHVGDPKDWYCYKVEDTEAIAKIAAEKLPMEFKKCNAYLNHKEVFLNPGEMCKKYNFDVYKLVQTPGDYVFTAPGALHQVRNRGISINSAINMFPDDPKSANVIQSKKQCSANCMFKEKSLNLPVIKLDHKIRHCLNAACTQVFASATGLGKHMPKCPKGPKKVTYQDISKVQCPWCEKMVKRLGAHIKAQHEDKKFKATCNLCGIETREFKTHLQNCRQCLTCGKTFNRSRQKAIEHFCLKKHNLMEDTSKGN